MPETPPPGFHIDAQLSQQMGVPVAVNPSTGKRVRLNAGSGPKLSQDQGQAQGYARLMSDAERSYKKARGEGFDPGNWRNVAASVVENLDLPVIGTPLAGLGPVLRDDVSDRAQQAQMVWADAQLKAMSGAASPPSEVRDNVAKFFPRFGENLDDIEAQKEASRRTAFDAARIRSGPAGPGIAPPGAPLQNGVRRYNPATGRIE
jgi:hypothetical protein